MRSECHKKCAVKSWCFYFSLSHEGWSCPKCAEWSLFLTFLLPKVCLAFKEYRSKEPSVLLAAPGNKRQRPFKGGRRVKSPADVRFQCVSRAPGSCSRLVAEASAPDSFVASQKEIPRLWVTLSPLPGASWAHRELTQSVLSLWSFDID